MASTTVGALIVKLTANTRQFDTAMKRAPKQLGGLQRATKAASGALVGLGRSFVGLAAGYIGISKFLESARELDQIVKFGDRIGIGVEALQKLQHAAALSGVETATLQMALQRMTRRVAEAAKGTGEAKAAISELGLHAKRLAQMGPDKQFLAIAEAMGKVKNQGDRVRLAMRLFDSEGVALVQMFDDLNAKMGETSTIEVFTAAQLEQVEKMNDAMTNLWATIKGVGRSAVTDLAPAVEKSASTLGNLLDRTFGKTGKYTTKLGTAWVIEKLGATFATEKRPHSWWKSWADQLRAEADRAYGVPDSELQKRIRGSMGRVRVPVEAAARAQRQEALADPLARIEEAQLDLVRKRLARIIGEQSRGGGRGAARFVAATGGVATAEAYELRARAKFQAPETTQQNILAVLRRQLLEEERQRRTIEELLRKMTPEEIMDIPK